VGGHGVPKTTAGLSTGVQYGVTEVPYSMDGVLMMCLLARWTNAVYLVTSSETGVHCWAMSMDCSAQRRRPLTLAYIFHVCQ